MYMCTPNIVNLGTSFADLLPDFNNQYDHLCETGKVVEPCITEGEGSQENHFPAEFSPVHPTEGHVFVRSRTSQ